MKDGEIILITLEELRCEDCARFIRNRVAGKCMKHRDKKVLIRCNICGVRYFF